jgi:cell division transport system ATP-binding protein
LIKFDDVGLTYSNKVRALRSVTFEVSKQDFVFLVGPTGGGKSSILRLIYRDAIPTHGRVHVFNRDMTKINSREIPYLRRRIGVIFQDFLLIPTKSTFQNVAFALEVKGASHRQIDSLVPEVLEQVGLEKKAKMKPTELSGGEQQRVCIARALVNKPDILLADEPTGNLDPDTSIEIMEIVDRINSRGCTVMVATHDENIVNRFRKRVMTVVAGAITNDTEKGGYTN